MDALERYRAYKGGKLNESEAHEFEKWLLENEDEALALEGLLEYPDEQLTSDVEDLKQWVNNQGDGSMSRSKYYGIAVAAAVIVLVMWGGGFMQSKNVQLYDELYARYQVEDGIVRGETNRTQAVAIALYSEGNCNDLITLMESEEGQRVSSGNLLLGICYMENGEHQRAIDVFAQVSENETESRLEAMQWYTALCYLRMNDEQKVRTIASALVQGKGFYASDALNLLNGLN